MNGSFGRVFTLVAILAAAGLGAYPRSEPRADASIPTEPPHEPDVDEWHPFELNPTGSGATPYEALLDEEPPPPTPEEFDENAPLAPERRLELSTDTKASVANVVNWANAHNGPAVHQAWSAYTYAVQQQAAITAAAYAAGLTGIDQAALP